MFGSKNIQQLSDEDLLSKYLEKGDKKFLGVLYSRYQTLVLGTSMKYLKNAEDSRDAVMDIFEIVSKDLFKYEVTYFKSWLYMVTKNYCLMRLSKEKTQRKRQDQFAASERVFMESERTIHPPEEDQKEQTLKALMECLDGLKEMQQQCLRLFYLQEQCYQEIADGTGYAMSKVKSYIQNGKRNLKICLENKHGKKVA